MSSNTGNTSTQPDSAELTTGQKLAQISLACPKFILVPPSEANDDTWRIWNQWTWISDPQPNSDEAIHDAWTRLQAVGEETEETINPCEACLARVKNSGIPKFYESTESDSLEHVYPAKVLCEQCGSFVSCGTTRRVAVRQWNLENPLRTGVCPHCNGADIYEESPCPGCGQRKYVRNTGVIASVSGDPAPIALADSETPFLLCAGCGEEYAPVNGHVEHNGLNYCCEGCAGTEVKQLLRASIAREQALCETLRELAQMIADEPNLPEETPEATAMLERLAKEHGLAFIARAGAAGMKRAIISRVIALLDGKVAINTPSPKSTT